MLTRLLQLPQWLAPDAARDVHINMLATSIYGINSQGVQRHEMRW